MWCETDRVAGFIWRLILAPICTECDADLRYSQQDESMFFHCDRCEFQTTRGVSRSAVIVALDEMIVEKYADAED
jgi:predicted amidophosphoribosyltransferase